MAISDILKQRAAGAQLCEPSHPRIAPLTVRNILAKRPPALCCVDSGMEALAVLRLMAQRDAEAVLVTEQGKLAGVFSEREYRRHAAAGEPAGSITVGAAMIPCAVTVTPEESAHHSMGIFTAHHVRHLPVGPGTAPIDILSLEELLGALAAHYEQIIRAFELDQQVMFLRGTYSC